MNALRRRSVPVRDLASSRPGVAQVGRRAVAALGSAQVATLALAAIGLVGASFFFAVVYPQTPGRLGMASVALVDDFALWATLERVVPSPHTVSGVSFALALAIVVAFAAQGVALHAVRRLASGRALCGIALVSLVALVISALALPNVSTDLFSYIASARVAVVHGQNPYETALSAFPGDQLYPYVSDQHSGSVTSKLPAWMLFSVGLAWVAGDDPVANVLLYRLVLAVLAVGAVALVGLALREVAPRHAAFGMVLFGWNPMVIVYAPSKTDTLMVFFLASAAFLLARRRFLSGTAAIVLSALVKLITLPLVALQLLSALSLRRWRQLALGCLVAVATAALVYLPFARGIDLPLKHLRLLGMTVSRLTPSLDSNDSTAGQVALAVGLVSVVLWQAKRLDGKTSTLFRAWGVVGLYFALFLTITGWAWYLMAPLAAVALSARILLWLPMLALSLASFSFSIWDSASSATFQLRDVVPVPRFVVYLALGIALAVVGGLLARRPTTLSG